ncbi:MAG TPA: dethiobiotin synthase [Chloroflexota bacterium]|nr:dethiobiotin synthase [Chloroflexota bacterium]
MSEHPASPAPAASAATRGASGARAVFVTGTDTGVGKTVATAAIGWALAQGGRRVGVLKPAQTGVAPGQPGDAEFVLAALDSPQPPGLACTYCFREPAAPLVAARAEHATLDVAVIRDRFERLQQASDVVLVEGAGGLLVPLAEGYSMADLARMLGLPLVVVARPGLGTLNHTLLTLEAARARGLDVLGIVLSAWREPVDLATRTNPALLSELGQAPLVGVLPWDDGIAVEELRFGRLRDWASAALAPTLGGLFDAAAFLTACARGEAWPAP